MRDKNINGLVLGTLLSQNLTIKTRICKLGNFVQQNLVLQDNETHFL